MKYAWLLLLPPAFALAEDVKPIPAAAPQLVTYELRDLRPAGFTQYAEAGDVIRQYFDFQNEQGGHHVIYEELPSLPPLRSMQGFKQAAIAYDSVCAIDVECTSKAFCVGDCKNMYYETANAPGDAIAPDRNKCRVTTLTCEKFVPRPPAAPAPAATPGT